ncbi:MAG: RNase HII [uncultured archaeon A07HB70]|nr:MAG: RNase HII [uncultured archaeon A07HB70]
MTADRPRVGADEAGKGPVIGPMVCAAVRAPAAALDGIDDSKALSTARRERLAARLRDDGRVAVATESVPVERIDDPETDMNGLTLAGQAVAVQAVVRPGDRVDADAADVDAARFERRLRAAVADGVPEVDVSAAHGADERYPVVGAASVVAKVERDRRVDALRDEYGAVGSGYPSDQTTRAFLRAFVDEHGRLPDCARASWSTCTDLLAAAERSALDEF